MYNMNSQVMASNTSKASGFSYAVNNRTALFKLIDIDGKARYFDSYNDAEACIAALSNRWEWFKATLYFKKGRSWELWEIPAENIVEIPAPVQVNDYAGTIDLTETADYVCYVDGEEFIVPSNVVSTITSLAKEKVAGWDDKVAMGYVYYDDYKAVVYRDSLAIKKNNDSQFGKLISFSVTPCETVSAVSEAPEAKIALSDDIYADAAQRMADAYACCEMPSFWMGGSDDDYMDNKIAEALGTDVTYVWEHIDINYDRLWSMAYDKWVEGEKEPVLEAYGEPVVVESNDGNKVAKMAC